MFDQFLGLPLHPLVVHAVVVLLPLGALGLLVLAAWSKGRRVGLPLVTAVLAVATGSAWVARFSGQALRQHVGVPDPHATLGGLLPLVATLTFVLAVVWWLRHRSGKDALWLRLLAAVVAVVAVVMTALVGHSGAQSAWGEVFGAPPVQDVAPPVSAPSESAPADSENETPAAGGHTASDVAEHASADDCWVIIDDTVYDLTAWVSRHPGGAERITALCGTDGTAAFSAQHSGNEEPQRRLTEFELGPLVSE